MSRDCKYGSVNQVDFDSQVQTLEKTRHDDAIVVPRELVDNDRVLCRSDVEQVLPDKHTPLTSGDPLYESNNNNGDGEDDIVAWRNGGNAPIINEILNLVKNIVGSGGFSLPAGVASFANESSAVYPTIVVTILLGFVNAFSFSLLGRVCDVSRSTTYQQAWEKTFGQSPSYYASYFNSWVGLVVTVKPLLGCWSFSIIIASTCQPLLNLFFQVTETQTLIAITVLVLLPLCLMENLESLAGFSMIGQLGTTVAAFTMILRFLDGSYQPGGRFYDHITADLQPNFGDDGWISFFNPRSLILISILSQGYVAHYNAPKYYYELKDRTPERFDVVSNTSFTIAALTYMTISCLGFLTFGDHCAGFILNNYSHHDPWASVSRLGVALSVLFSYPLLFQGGRDGWIAMMTMTSSNRRGAMIPTWFRHLITVVLLVVLLALAIWVPNLTFVLSLAGATLSSCVIYIFPSLMFQALVQNNGLWCDITGYRTKWIIKASVAMMWLGVFLGVSGTIVSIARVFM